MNPVLAAWNEMDAEAATTAVLPCNGSGAWAAALTARRPLVEPEQLFTAADQVWDSLRERDWQEAFDSHPRIGEQHARAASATSLQWSAAEQSAAKPDAVLQAALAEGNRAYEERFGRVFIVCATGKSAGEMLAILSARLGHEPTAELLETAEQQRRITQLRLRKWLGLPAARCEDV